MDKGATYLEVIISLIILLIFLNPMYFTIINLKKSTRISNEYFYIENEIEKIRGFYKKYYFSKDYIAEDKSLEINIKKNKLIEEIYKVEIEIKKDLIERRSVLYVYKQK